MMGRLNHDQGQLFYSFCLDDVVPRDHRVREIAGVLDLLWVGPGSLAFSRARNERFKESDIFRRVFERVVEACIGLFEFLNGREYTCWGTLTEALRTGRPQTGYKTFKHFGALYSDPQRLAVFVKAMTSGSLAPAKTIAARFPWDRHKTFLDVGTAQGCLPVQIALAQPHLTGAGFDLPILTATFDSYVKDHCVSDRVRFLPGDFFAEPLPGADVLIMGHVLHNWDLATKRMLLHKAHVALPTGGALIVYERLIDDERRAGSAGLLSSLNMLVMTAGGFNFTAADCIGWMRDADFREMRTEPLVAHQSMIVAIK